MRKWLSVVLSAGALALAACGDDDGGGAPSAADIERYCGTSCGKAAECGLLGPISQDACESQCVQGSMNSMGAGSCSIDSPDACISDYAALSCAAVQAGTSPASCECEGEPTTGGTTGTGGITGTGGTAAVGSCADLAECCDSVPESGRSGCTTAVGVGVEAACAAALSSYQQAGFCS